MSKQDDFQKEWKLKLLKQRVADIGVDKLEKPANEKYRSNRDRKIEEIAEAAKAELIKQEGVGSGTRVYISVRDASPFKDPIYEIAGDMYKDRLPEIGLGSDDTLKIKARIAAILKDNIEEVKFPAFGEPTRNPQKAKLEEIKRESMKNEFIDGKTDKIFNAMLAKLLDVPIVAKGR